MPGPSPGDPDPPGAAVWVPARLSLRALREAVQDCRGCEVLVGEQLGDREDRRGAPFVGPAGRLLDRALAEAGIDPDRPETFPLDRPPGWTLATAHPSAVLRSRDRGRDRDALVADLRVAAAALDPPETTPQEATS